MAMIGSAKLFLRLTVIVDWQEQSSRIIGDSPGFFRYVFTYERVGNNGMAQDFFTSKRDHILKHINISFIFHQAKP